MNVKVQTQHKDLGPFPSSENRYENGSDAKISDGASPRNTSLTSILQKPQETAPIGKIWGKQAQKQSWVPYRAIKVVSAVCKMREKAVVKLSGDTFSSRWKAGILSPAVENKWRKQRAFEEESEKYSASPAIRK